MTYVSFIKQEKLGNACDLRYVTHDIRERNLLTSEILLRHSLV